MSHYLSRLLPGDFIHDVAPVSKQAENQSSVAADDQIMAARLKRELRAQKKAAQRERREKKIR